MSKIIIAEHHDQVFTYWKNEGMHDLRVAHVDFHCDMRGLLIDRKSGTASFTSARETKFVDRGNFLAHAIMDGTVKQLTWVHSENSGRGYDHGPVVAYESDVMAPLYRFRQKRSGRDVRQFEFRECLFSNWEGLNPGEQLDLDWDALASVEYETGQQEKLISEFLSKNLRHAPEVTFLVYSPGYSNPDRTLYMDFSQELAKKFRAEIVELPKTELVTDGERFGAARKIVKRLLPDAVLAGKRSLTRHIRQIDCANDVGFYEVQSGR